jgi:hypothetical protein
MKPLGLPEGSIRAMIILAMLWIIIFPITIAIFKKEDIFPAVKDLLMFAMGVAAGLLKDYFSGRKTEEDKPEK